MQSYFKVLPYKGKTFFMFYLSEVWYCSVHFVAGVLGYSTSPSIASLTGGYEYLPAAGRFSHVGAKSLNT